MELLCVLAAVAALFCGCAVLTLKCRVPASVAPLTALSAIVAVLTLAAMAGVLYPAAWLLYLLCLAGGVWVAASCRGSTGAAQRLSPRAACCSGAWRWRSRSTFSCGSLWRRTLTS